MPGRLGPRFAIEALFLIALAVGVAYADLASKWIVAVMAGGWLVVALLGLPAARIWAAAPPWRRPYYVPAPPPRARPGAQATPARKAIEPEPVVVPGPKPEPEPVAMAEPEPKVEPEPEPEAATIIAPRADPAAAAGTEIEAVRKPATDADPKPEPEPVREGEPEERPRPKLEPLEASPKRRWFRRREHEEVSEDTSEIE